MPKNKRLGPVIGGKLPGVKLCEPCQERFKEHMNIYLPPDIPPYIDTSIAIPDFLLCPECWDRLLNEAKLDKTQICQGIATVH